MAKQFSILATDIDLQQLEEGLRAAGDVDILSDVVTEDLRDLRPLERLAIPLADMGKKSLFCYLAPHNMPRTIAAERDSPVKVYIDLRKSHLIEFWRPYYDTRVIRQGRLYYQNRTTRGGHAADVDPAFRSWADGVMTRVRRMLKLQKELGAYVGAHAAAQIALGRLTVVS